MARAIDPDAQIEFILPEDQHLPEGSPWRTVWIYQPLGLTDQRVVQDRAAQVTGDDVQVKSGTVTLETLRRGLKGVRNFRDPKQTCDNCKGSGKVEAANQAEREDTLYDTCPRCQGAGCLCVEFTTKQREGKQMPSDDFLRRISPKHRQAISTAISSDSALDEVAMGES